MKLMSYFALLCQIDGQAIDNFKGMRVVSPHWEALLNKASLSPISLMNCAVTVDRMDKAHIFKYYDQSRMCTYAKFEERGLEFWHSNLAKNWTRIHIAKHYWAPSKVSIISSL